MILNSQNLPVYTRDHSIPFVSGLTESELEPVLEQCKKIKSLHPILAVDFILLKRAPGEERFHFVEAFELNNNVALPEMKQRALERKQSYLN